jgi:hypothetical protein
MQTTMIPWHIFMDALAQQQRAPVVNWLERWRFTNDGVFMAHELFNARLADRDASCNGAEKRIVN